jgi:hypothetical protein
MEETVKLKKGSDRHESHTPLQWRQLTLSLLLILLGAFCLLKCLGWAWVYSGNYGLPSHAKIVLMAHQRSLAYFWAGLLVECVLVTNLTIHLKFHSTELTGAPKALIRVIAALTIAGIGTLSTMFLMSWVGKLLR